MELGVNWIWGWGNSPDFYIFGEVPEVDWRQVRHEQRENCWRAQADYRVRYLAHSNDGKNHGGFGERVFEVLDSNGVLQQLGGPWSGSADWCNRHFPDREPCIEVTLKDQMLAANVTATKLVELWREARRLVKQTRQEGAGIDKRPEWAVSPLRLGYAKFSWRDTIMLTPLLSNGMLKGGEGKVYEELAL